MTALGGDLAASIVTRSRPLSTAADLDAIVERARGRRVIAIGEASHGTHEFYRWRGILTRRLIEEQRIDWIGVEGDWPDCWRLDRWVRGLADQDLDARGILAGFSRWPTWMWANTDVADFLDWLHARNRRRPTTERVGFYGLDVYSLWDSLSRTMSWLAAHATGARSSGRPPRPLLRAPVARGDLGAQHPYRRRPGDHDGRGGSAEPGPAPARASRP